MFSIQERVCRDQITPALEKEIKRINEDAFSYEETSSIEMISNAAICQLKSTTSTVFFAWKREHEVEVLAGYIIAKQEENRQFIPEMEADTGIQKEMFIVSDIAVASSDQRKGLGTLLMQKVFEVAEKSGLRVMLMYRGNRDSLNRFYLKFNPIAPEHSFFEVGNNAGYLAPVFDPKISLAAIEESDSNKDSKWSCTLL